jgi:hypothetical protein
MRLRAFSKGRFLKKVPPDLAVTQCFEVYAFESLGVSHHFFKPQNIGSLPSDTVDTALPTARREKRGVASAVTKQFFARVCIKHRFTNRA